jgi:hypothetical protein
MVSLDTIISSNKHIASDIPPGIVAIFVGGTSGIGETSMKQLAKHAVQPRIYFVGRSLNAGHRLTSELQAINPGGIYHFIQSDDISLLKNVDEVCDGIKSRESSINLIFLTVGALTMGIGKSSLQFTHKHKKLTMIFDTLYRDQRRPPSCTSPSLLWPHTLHHKPPADHPTRNVSPPHRYSFCGGKRNAHRH